MLQPVEGPERHHLGQVAGDPEDHQGVGGRASGVRAPPWNPPFDQGSNRIGPVG